MRYPAGLARHFLPKQGKSLAGGAAHIMPNRQRPPRFLAAQMMAIESSVSFITIAQQAGAECPSLPQALASALNEGQPRSKAWTVWDRELIEKVSQDNRIPADLVTSVETSGHSWIDDLLAGVFRRPDDVAVFHRVKEAVLNLARGGRVILVGHGTVYMTRGLEGGVQIRLIAPRKVRVSNIAARFNLSRDDADRHIRRLDRQRRIFFRRFWPDWPLSDDMFTAVFNTARLNCDRLTRPILQMLLEK
jgi:hypothetical protein